MYCKRLNGRPSLVFLSVVTLALFAALPGPAAASSSDIALSQGPVAPTIAVPGVFSLNLGQGFTSNPEGLTLDTAEIDIPAVNAVASVTALSLNPSFQLKDWQAFKLTQSAPRETETYSISNATVTVGGPSSGYSTAVYADFDLHGNERVKVNGTFGVSFDGLARTFGVGAQDADMALQLGPLNIALTGANSLAGGMTIDEVILTSAQRGGTVAVSGLKTGPGGMDWNALDLTMAPVAIGNAVVVSPAQVHVGGSATGYARTAVVGLAVNAGDVAQVGGNIVTNTDPATGSTQVALQNGAAQFALQGFSLGFDGMNIGPTGTSVDTVKLQADPVGLTAQVKGLVIDPEGPAAFDSATIQYQPEGASAGSGFVMDITRTDAGYVMTTMTLLPVMGR